MECLALAGLPRVLAEPDADPVAILPGGIEQECVDIARVGGHVGPGDRGPSRAIAPPAIHVALLTPEALLRAGLNPAVKVLDVKGRFRCRRCGRKGRAVVSIKWRGRSE